MFDFDIDALKYDIFLWYTSNHNGFEVDSRRKLSSASLITFIHEKCVHFRVFKCNSSDTLPHWQAYQTELFLDKNKNYVVAEHQSLLNASKCPFISSLFPPLSDNSSKSSKFSSVGTNLKFFPGSIGNVRSH